MKRHLAPLLQRPKRLKKIQNCLCFFFSNDDRATDRLLCSTHLARCLERRAEPAGLLGGVALDSLLVETVNREPRIQHMLGCPPGGAVRPEAPGRGGPVWRVWSRPWGNVLTVCSLSLLQLVCGAVGHVTFLLSVLNRLLNSAPGARPGPGLVLVLVLLWALESPGLILLSLCLDTETRSLFGLD